MSSLYYFYTVKIYFYLFFVLLIPIQCLGQEAIQWVNQSLSSSVSISFPGVPQKNDTLNQTLYHYTDEDDVMIASATYIPDSLYNNIEVNLDTLLNHFIQSTIQGATTLIFSNTLFKNQKSIFYKVRIDDDLNPIRGLVVDSYNFVIKDTIYSISYLRYNAKELYNYNQQRKYFDMVEVNNASSSPNDSTILKDTTSTVKENSSTSTSYIKYIVFLIFVFSLGALFFYFKNKK